MHWIVNQNGFSILQSDCPEYRAAWGTVNHAERRLLVCWLLVVGCSSLVAGAGHWHADDSCDSSYSCAAADACAAWLSTGRHCDRRRARGHLLGVKRARVQFQVGHAAGKVFAAAREVRIATQGEIAGRGSDRRRDANRLHRLPVDKQRQFAGPFDDAHVVPRVLLRSANRSSNSRCPLQCARRACLRTRRSAADRPCRGTRR